MPVDLIDGYDLDEFVAFTRFSDYDILDVHFGELEGPDEWVEYELGSLMPIRDELMDGDLRALYIIWLASRRMLGTEDEEEDYEIIGVPTVPSELGTLTAAQQALAALLQVPQELLLAAARHSKAAPPSSEDDVVAWVELLPQARRSDYLVRLARNGPGLSRLLIKELRELSQGKTRAAPATGEPITYATLLAESKAIQAKLEREKYEQEQQTRQRHRQAIRDHQDEYWQRAELAVKRQLGAGYDEAVQLLSELREVADHYKETQEFQARFHTWVRSHLRRPALVKRLQDRKFTLPEA